MALFLASGAVAIGIVSLGDGSASAQNPDRQGFGLKHGLGNYEEALADELDISVETLRNAQKAAFTALRESNQNMKPRDRGAFQEALADELNISVATLEAAQKAARDEAIDEAVASGRLTPEQAEKLKSLEFGQGAGLLRDAGKRVIHAVRNVFEAAAGVIGITPAELKEGLASGKSLAAIAEDNNVDRDELEEELIDAIEAQIDKAAADGLLTQEQATRFKEGLNERIGQIIDHEGGLKGRMGPGPFGGPFVPRVR
jgi:ribosomal protein S20